MLWTGHPSFPVEWDEQLSKHQKILMARGFPTTKCRMPAVRCSFRHLTCGVVGKEHLLCQRSGGSPWF